MHERIQLPRSYLSVWISVLLSGGGKALAAPPDRVVFSWHWSASCPFLWLIPWFGALHSLHFHPFLHFPPLLHSLTGSALIERALTDIYCRFCVISCSLFLCSGRETLALLVWKTKHLKKNSEHPLVMLYSCTNHRIKLIWVRHTDTERICTLVKSKNSI